MDWQYELQRALEDPALAAFDGPSAPGAEAAAAAYRVALCLGYCRLLGLALPDDLDGTLPAPEAIAAAQELTRHLAVWVQEAGDLPSRWDTAAPGVEDHYCADLLKARMDAWAAYLAITEAYDDCLVQDEPAAQDLGQALDRLVDALDRFDQTLQQPEILALLSTLAGTPLLDNWRQSLGVPDGRFLPWWLDGTLEQEDRRIEAECLAVMQELQACGRTALRPPIVPSGVPGHCGAAIREVQVLQALAAEPNDARPPIVALFKWASPDGRWIARLSCPQCVEVGACLPLEFFSPDGQPARELAGSPVRLAGYPETIDPHGVARFDVQKLQTLVGESQQPLTLEVGQAHEPWLAIPSA